MRRLSSATGLLIALAVLLVPTRSYAQQTLNISIGGFVPNGFDSRTRDDRGLSEDVLRSDLSFLTFEGTRRDQIHEFSRVQFNAEYLVGVGDFLEAGLGVGYDQKTVPSFYTFQVNTNGADIQQDLKLRTVPFTATIRFLPLGRSTAVEPYIGGGVAIINWRYTESGEWVDPSDNSIFVDSFTGKGTSTGPMIVGGLRVPLGAWGFGGEIRWQDVKGDLPSDLGFATTRVGQRPWIDLGGWSYLATFQVHF